MSNSSLPLVIDLDGTLAKSDGLVDAFLNLILKSPKLLPGAFKAFRLGRLEFKTKLDELGAYHPASIPLNNDLVAYLREQHANGRELHLVTASPQSVADEVASRVGLFHSVTGSSNGVNLKGLNKANFLTERFPDGFSYAGNDHADLEVWRRARSIVIVSAPSRVESAASNLGIPVERIFRSRPATLAAWLRLMRIHQWSKNVLLFVPLVMAQLYTDATAILHVVLGFVCMGLVASATYIINDLGDLDSDRRHHTKRFRPLAAAEISAMSGLIFAASLGLAGLLGGLLLDPLFSLTLIGYAAISIAYSVRIKNIPVLDLFVLGLLYTMRIVMGTALIHVPPSPWLLVFSLFFFFSLSTAKRHSEIVHAARAGHQGRIPGRGYLVSDSALTLALGISTSSLAVLLLFLYVTNDAYPAGAYNHPVWLWAMAPLVFLWTSRIWLKSHRGRLDEDPVSFALRDWPSLLLATLVALCFVLAVV